MDEVARRARVGRATLYKHFPGRDALIGAVVQTELAKFFAEVQSGVERYDDPDERLVHGFAHAYRLLSHHPAVSPILRLNPEIFALRDHTRQLRTESRHYVSSNHSS